MVRSNTEQSIIDGYDSSGEYNTIDADINAPKLKRILNEISGDIKWDFEALVRTNGETFPLPPFSSIVSHVLEKNFFRNIKEEIEPAKWGVHSPDNNYQYPDMTVRDRDGNIFAVDVKTGITKNGKRLKNPMTLGSYAGYFRNPNKKIQGITLPYNEYDQHLIVGFIYYWDESKQNSEMVSIENTFVQPKWKIASKKAGSGNTQHIGSVKDIHSIVNGNGDFSTEEEFEDYWRSFETEG